MDRQHIIDKHDIATFVEERGFKLFRSGKELTTNCCPVTTHRENHRCVNINVEKQTWYCNDCGTGGSVIDWVMKESNVGIKQAMETLGGSEVGDSQRTGAPDAQPEREAVRNGSAQTLKEVETYNYTDENGSLLYQVIRYEPKTFKQRQPKGEGWQWDLQGVTRVLYNLPEVLLAQTVFITEGEKDANNLNDLGLTAAATTTAGGAQSWLPAYADTLKGKDVVVFEDSDKVGRQRGDVIIESLQDVAASVKRVRFAGYKDVSDWLQAQPEALRAIKLNEVLDKTPHAVAPLPIYSIWEMENRYAEFAASLPKHSFGLGNFSKTLGNIVEQIYPGELVMIMGDTTQGKTAVMQAIARSASPLNTLFFELELPLEAMFERSVQMERGCFGRDVLQGYKDQPKRFADSFKGLHHIMICPESGITMDTVEKYVTKSELKFGEHPAIVMIDYMGLVRKDYSRGRYEAMAYSAEQAKIMAKRTNTIVFMGSQISRPHSSKEYVTDPQIHDAKGAGELENSANLILGIGRPEETLLRMKVLKWTRGQKGATVDFDFDGAKMQMTERVLVP